LREGSPPDGSGWKVRVVPNKFPALSREEDMGEPMEGMYERMNGVGAHEVIIETPEHDKRLERHTPESLSLVLDTYRQRLIELNRDARFRYVIIFKNEGEQAGASLSHAHSQLIATPVTPKRVREELIGAREYYESKGRCIFCDIIREERTGKQRIVEESEDFIAFCPFASRFPYETWVLPKKHSPDYQTLTGEELLGLARILIGTMRRLSEVLNRPQYNYILHTGPVRYAMPGYWTTLDMDWHWHIEIMPRVTDIAGFEWGTGYYINPTLPEEAARYMREVKV
jgi:UDPglucose--hexose-1-phosphate uridylyltransferase